MFCKIWATLTKGNPCQKRVVVLMLINFDLENLKILTQLKPPHRYSFFFQMLVSRVTESISGDLFHSPQSFRGHVGSMFNFSNVQFFTFEVFSPFPQHYKHHRGEGSSPSTQFSSSLHWKQCFTGRWKDPFFLLSNPSSFTGSSSSE